MGNANSLAWTSLALALGVSSIAVILGLLLWRERTTRDPGLGDEDRKHFLLQDIRRGFGLVLMALVAAGVYAGSRMPTFVIEPGDPTHLVKAARHAHPNRLFLAVWLAVFGSTVILLGLAMMDWIATRRYARRHREAINDERLELLRDTLRHPDSRENGQANSQPGETF